MSVLHPAAIRRREMCVFVCEMEVILRSRDDSLRGCLAGGEQVFPASGSHQVFQLFPNSGYEDPNTLLSTAPSIGGPQPSGMLRINPEEFLHAPKVTVFITCVLALPSGPAEVALRR